MDFPPPVSRVRHSGSRDLRSPQSRVRSKSNLDLNLGAEMIRQFPDDKGFNEKSRSFILGKVKEGRVKLLDSDDEFYGFRYGVDGQEGFSAVIGTKKVERNGRDGFHYVVMSVGKKLFLANKSVESLRETLQDAAANRNRRFLL